MIGLATIPTRKGFSKHFRFCQTCGKRFEIKSPKGKKMCDECKKVHMHKCKRCDKIFKDNDKVKSYCPDCVKPNRGQQQKLAREK